MDFIMKGTLGSFVKRAMIEAYYANINFNQLTHYFIKKQIKGAINNVANEASKFLEQLK